MHKFVGKKLRQRADRQKFSLGDKAVNKTDTKTDETKVVSHVKIEKPKEVEFGVP